MRRARSGDVAAYEALVARHSAVAFRLAVLLGARDEAEDVLQAAFVKAYQGLRGFRDGAAFRPWLLRIVANETHNLTRSRGRRAAFARRLGALAETEPPTEPVDAVLGAERRSALLAAVRALPEKERLVVTYRYFLELSEAETAQALGWPKGTVKSRLSRALAHLQGHLAPDPLGSEEASHG